MDPIALDIRTLSFITVLFAFGFGAGLVTFGVAHPTYSGLKQVGLGLAFIGLGCLLIGYRHTVSPAISIVAANTFLVLSFVLINLGIRNFRQLARSDVWFGVPIVACVVMTLYYFTYVQPSFPHRVFWVGVWLAVLSAMCCRSVLQDARNMAVPQKILATGFGLFSVFMLIRSWLVLDESAMQDFMAASTIHGLAFLAVILFVVNVSFGLIWMANDQLLQEHKKYEQIIATTPDGIALLDKDGRYRMVNAAILKFLGLSREEVLGKRSLDLFGPDFYEKITLPNIQKAFAGETGATSTWVTLPHREKIYVSVTYHPLPDAKGNIPLAAIHITNMTALHLAQQEKQRIFDLSLDICCVGGMDGYFLEINPAWTQMLGWSEKEVLSRPWSDFTHPDDLQISRDAVQQLTEGKPVVDFVNRVLAKDGTYRYISWMTYPDMEAQRFYSVGRDVSNRIRWRKSSGSSRQRTHLPRRTTEGCSCNAWMTRPSAVRDTGPRSPCSCWISTISSP